MADWIQCSTCLENPIYWNLSSFNLSCDHFPDGIPVGFLDNLEDCHFFDPKRCIHIRIDPANHKYAKYRRSPEEVAETKRMLKAMKDQLQGSALIPNGFATEALIQAQKELVGEV
jgi:hypothetical protein